MDKDWDNVLRRMNEFSSIMEQMAVQEEKDLKILEALDISLAATDIVSLLQDPERLRVAVKKLKMKAFL